MEVHLVHWNNKYNTYEEAATKADGLAVVGFFIEVRWPPDVSRCKDLSV